MFNALSAPTSDMSGAFPIVTLLKAINKLLIVLRVRCIHWISHWTCLMSIKMKCTLLYAL